MAQAIYQPGSPPGVGVECPRIDSLSHVTGFQATLALLINEVAHASSAKDRLQGVGSREPVRRPLQAGRATSTKTSIVKNNGSHVQGTVQKIGKVWVACKRLLAPARRIRSLCHDLIREGCHMHAKARPRPSFTEGTHNPRNKLALLGEAF